MGILNISMTGLAAFQRALDVTSHNIANANTEGYSRQITTLASRIGATAGDGTVGAGVRVSQIKRSYDGLVVRQLQGATTGVGRLEILDEMTNRVNSLLADPDTGLNSSLQTFFGSVQDLTNDPSSVPTRQAMIGQADGLAGRFRAVDNQLSSLNSEVNERVRQAVAEINGLAQSISDVNTKIATAGPDSDPNDLLDLRDRLVLDLSRLVAVQTVAQDDGTLNVFVGSGQGLIIGTEPQQLLVIGNEFDSTEARIAFASDTLLTPLENTLSGGTLGGLMEFRDRVLSPARESLGQTAIAFAQAFNTQHQSGMDLRGALGGDFFSINPPTILPSSANTGLGTATATVIDLGALTGQDYVLTFDGANYNVIDPIDNTSVPFTGLGTPADPFVFGGMSVEVGGAPAAGDRILIRSSRGTAATMQNLMTDPQSVAIAAATRSRMDLNNLGNATLSPAVTVDPADPNLLNTATIEFLDASTYSINGAGSFAYTSGDPIVINGSQVTITGTPDAGDRFVIEANFGSTGDNANGLLLGDVQSVDILDGGIVSINENYGRLVSEIGSTTNQVIAGLDASLAVQRNAEAEVLSVSGVNLDEEAARLVQLQQAYQASAQVISIAATLFDTVLGMTRR
ncbi:MAG: flagellar hook-associated protein FlgK [Woeseiaceae bacterium]|nr:flagellar hook-associated protein FlgK [Woeseiaceae bacterium]